MDEWVVHRPHHNRLRRIVRETGEGQAERCRLLAPWARIDDGPRRRRRLDAILHDREYRAEIAFGRKPNHGIEKALS